MTIPAPSNHDTILPDILEVASEHGIALGKPLRHRPDETRACCPFCGDRKYHLYLNSIKQAFHCYRCGESGGIVKFIAKLQNASEYSVLEELINQTREKNLWPNKKVNKKKTHPGQQLNVYQLRLIGYECRPNWNNFFKEEPVLAKQYADAVWEKWQKFIEYEQIQAMKKLVLSLHVGTYSIGVEGVRNRSKEIGYDLLTPCLQEYSNGQPPIWVIEGNLLAFSWIIGEMKKELEKKYRKYRRN
jgi:hypothetical protein